jgi:hypothetical protein
MITGMSDRLFLDTLASVLRDQDVTVTFSPVRGEISQEPRGVHVTASYRDGHIPRTFTLPVDWERLDAAAHPERVLAEAVSGAAEPVLRAVQRGRKATA